MNSVASSWATRLRAYTRPDNGRALFELAVTVVPFVGLWIAMVVALQWSVLLSWVLAVPTAGFLMRLFMIQHDCGHGSVFTSTGLNMWVGRILGVLTLTPFDYWRRTHAIHHATSGHLERRGLGDIDVLTLREYCARSRLGRFVYRIYRHPLVLFVLGPSYVFILKHRLPVGIMRQGVSPWISTMATNLAIIGLGAGIAQVIGASTLLLVHLPVVIIAGAGGMWLFYIQHQFQHTSWDIGESWERQTAALAGSSYYALPAPLMWITANVGIHHVHHLASRIPFHRLPDVLDDFPELRNVNRMTLRRSLACANLGLWDEDFRELISFAEARRRLRSQSGLGTPSGAREVP